MNAMACQIYHTRQESEKFEMDQAKLVPRVLVGTFWTTLHAIYKNNSLKIGVLNKQTKEFHTC
jgi:hypothetical protein